MLERTDIDMFTHIMGCLNTMMLMRCCIPMCWGVSHNHITTFVHLSLLSLSCNILQHLLAEGIVEGMHLFFEQWFSIDRHLFLFCHDFGRGGA